MNDGSGYGVGLGGGMSGINSSVSTGSLRTKISLKGGAASFVGPFYTLKQELPPKSAILGSNDLLSVYDLSATYSRFCGTKKMKEDLASFLPHIYGNFNFSQTQDISSLKMLVEKPPITGKEITSLSASAMSGFRLAPGPVDERYRHLFEKKRDSDSLNGYEERKDPTQRYKNSLESLEDEPERKKHKSDKKEKKKKKDKKKRDKDRDDRKHKKNSDGSTQGSAPPSNGPPMMQF